MMDISIKVSHQPAKLGGDRYCVSGDKIFLVFRMISQDHLTKVLCDFMGDRPLW